MEAEGTVAAAKSRGLGLGQPPREIEILADADLAVEAEGPVVVARGGQIAGALAVDDDEAQAAAALERATDPGDGEVVALVIGRLVGLHVEEPEVEASGLAGQARTADDRDLRAVLQADASTEEQVDAARALEGAAGGSDLEEPGVLQEERALLGEEEAETVEVDLLVVDLDLGRNRC